MMSSSQMVYPGNQALESGADFALEASTILQKILIFEGVHSSGNENIPKTN